MFALCTEYNQDLSSWNLSSVTHSANMFQGNIQKYNKFNQPGIQGWNINPGVHMFNNMFRYSNMADLAGINGENGTSGNKGSWFTAIS
jgi:surface protein